MRQFVLVFFFAVSAVFHAAALKYPSISIPEPPLEHFIFTLVNLGFAGLMVAWPRWKKVTVWASRMLFIQQTVRHLPLFVMSVAAGGFDIQSLLAVVGTFVVMLTLTIMEREK